MLKWFSINDILAGFSVSKSLLTNMCRQGKLGYMRIRDNRFKGNPGQYLIPECELILKLSEYKTGEPLFKDEHQPSEFLTLRNQQCEEQIMKQFVGDYNAYLRSDHWRHIRDLALKRDRFTCQLCGTALNLRVHHIHYEHVGSDLELDDVVTLCDECHSKIHSLDHSFTHRS